MSTKALMAEACLRLHGLTKLTRDEMRLVGYAEDAPEIDVCAGTERLSSLAPNEPRRYDLGMSRLCRAPDRADFDH